MGLRERLQELAVDGVIVAADSARQGARMYGDLLRRVNLGVGPFRATPEGAMFVRDLLLAQLREALDIPEPAALGMSDERTIQVPLKAPDPAAVARAMLELQPRLLREIIERDGGDVDHAPRSAVQSAEDELRRQFARLLDPSKAPESELLPSLLSIVAQLAPDQARMVRHLHLEGAAPAVDVVAAPRFSRGATGRLMAQSLNVLTDRSGGDDAERGPAHLHNLIRLGLVAIEERELPDHDDYQLIEAGKVYQEVVRHVEEDLELKARTLRRTVRLTPLGHELCRLTLTPAISPTELPPALGDGDEA